MWRGKTRTLDDTGTRARMFLAAMALTGVALVAYWVLLSRLATSLETEKPNMFATLGRPGNGDYLMAGLTVGDGYISKLEALRHELSDAPRTLSLMRAVRWAWASTLFLAIAGIFILLGTSRVT